MLLPSIVGSGIIPPQKFGAGVLGFGHRYWRIRNLSGRNSVGNSVIQAEEVELRETVSGPDATGSGVAGSNDSATSANAFDNNNATIFFTQTTTGDKILSYDFNSGVEKDIVEFTWRNRTTIPNEAPGMGYVEYSDDNALWISKFAYGFHDWTAGETKRCTWHSLPGINLHKYWRINITANKGSGDNLAVGEIEFRATSGSPTQSPYTSSNSGAIYDSPLAGAFLGKAAYDGTHTTSWIPAANALIGWLGYSFDNPVAVTQIAIKARSGQLTQAPRDFTIQYSDDGTTWTTHWSVVNAPNYVSDVFQVFTKP